MIIYFPVYCQLYMRTRTTLNCICHVVLTLARANIAIESCIRDIRQWMCEKKLLLKDDKTEFLLVGSSKQLAKVSIDGLRVGDYNISPSPSLRNLGTWIDSYLNMDVRAVVRKIRAILKRRCHSISPNWLKIGM